MSRPKILLVEDDSNLGYILQEYLSLKNFDVTWLQESTLALPFLEKERVDLCLLDVMMPQKDGFQLGGEIKQLYPHLPFLFLTAKSLKIDKLKGFNLGADDFMSKPIDEEELVARINAVLRRSFASKNLAEVVIYQIGTYVFDPVNQSLIFEGERTLLTAKESELLQALCISKGRLLSRKETLKKLWGDTDYFSRRSMDVFISKLRNYLAKDPFIKIVNIHGKGFMLEDDHFQSTKN
jgi:DNA-binding response OmpR family regulator